MDFNKNRKDEKGANFNMKTNHRRNFIAHKDPKANEIKTKKYSEYLPLSDRFLGAIATAGDSTCGKHGVSQKRRGAKKFIHSRARFYENSEIRKIIKNSSFEDI
jgi:hypothetical protein